MMSIRARFKRVARAIAGVEFPTAAALIQGAGSLATYVKRSALGLASAATLLSLPTAAWPLTIAVDVGHSLAKSGSTSAQGQTEFAYNHALAEEVIASLRASGARVMPVGLDGSMDVLTERTRAAAGADLLLSIHHDSVQPQYLPIADQFHGYGVFVSHKNVDPGTSARCASAIADQLQAIGRSPSLHHAEPIKGENRPLVDRARGVYDFADLVVLKTARQPAVLVEAAIIVNRAEEAMVADPRNRKLIGNAIAAGAIHCMRTSSADRLSGQQ